MKVHVLPRFIQLFQAVTLKNICEQSVCDWNKKISAVLSGARFGLRLTLNIEQYEYMMGPNTDAGVKVSLVVTAA